MLKKLLISSVITLSIVLSLDQVTTANLTIAAQTVAPAYTQTQPTPNELPDFADEIGAELRVFGEATNSECKAKLANVLAAVQGALLLQDISIELVNDNSNKLRGSAAISTIKINCSLDQSQFTYTFFHELGHVQYALIIGEESTNQYDNFENPFSEAVAKYNTAGAPNYLTEYATTNEQEDFAESFAMYMTNPQLFQQKTSKSPVLKAKYEFIENYTHPISSSISAFGSSLSHVN